MKNQTEQGKLSVVTFLGYNYKNTKNSVTLTAISDDNCTLELQNTKTKKYQTMFIKTFKSEGYRLAGRSVKVPTIERCYFGDPHDEVSGWRVRA